MFVVFYYALKCLMYELAMTLMQLTGTMAEYKTLPLSCIILGYI